MNKKTTTYIALMIIGVAKINFHMSVVCNSFTSFGSGTLDPISVANMAPPAPAKPVIIPYYPSL